MIAETQKSVARFTVAVNRNKTDAGFIPCVAFDKKAELLEKYFKKGLVFPSPHGLNFLLMVPKSVSTEPEDRTF